MINEDLNNIIKKYSADGTIICFSIKSINSQTVEYHWNSNKFMYSASLSKLFIALEAFKQIENGEIPKDLKIKIKKKNIVGDPSSFKSKDKVSKINQREIFLINLIQKLLSESSNTAANELMDLLDRKSINTSAIHFNNWYGSEVHRKFLPRSLEEQDYKKASINKTCSKHVVDFFKNLEEKSLLNSELTQLFIESFSVEDFNYPYTLRVNNTKYYNKYGSFKINLFTYGFLQAVKKIIRLKSIKSQSWLHDSGVLEINGNKYAIALMTYNKSLITKKISIKKFSKEIISVIEKKSIRENPN